MRTAAFVVVVLILLRLVIETEAFRPFSPLLLSTGVRLFYKGVMPRVVGSRLRGGRGGARSCFLSTGLLLPLCLLLLLSCGNEASHRADFQCPAYTAEGFEVTCLTFRGATYVVLRVDLRAARIRMLWKDSGGVPYSSLDQAYRQNEDLLALTNAGIYARNHTPEGLHVEGGLTLSPLNPNNGDGNFYLKPNGVFYVADGSAGIVATEKLDSPGGPTGVREATQSGPLLVIDGEVNQSLNPDTQSLYVRNGVGVSSPGEVYIVISEGGVNLHDFASVFKEQLHCRDALYLDGCVSHIYLPARGVYVPGRRQCDKGLVGLLGVVKRR
jgi:uncharacterized protein YigE (DUF2233 family)